ncbi:hypothetical protein EVJ58_g10893 [Rhodofomes roseus]|uniref:Uncharacterized protein n=1 Tax=Rhodofomes roseus TaxID=34475 RepID=A0A4Y9XM21_9APHY|nr:hypothetical protein EVJ58_g10893 [Rhodofomes roseus]
MPDSMVATHDSTNTASLKLSLDSKTIPVTSKGEVHALISGTFPI